MKKQYVIGDVHGYYKTLLELVDRLPADAELIFVGDLIDRGPQSFDVVRFVRGGGHRCVMGNHEAMMVQDGPAVLEARRWNRPLDPGLLWFYNGGIRTLESYELAMRHGGDATARASWMERFEDDLQWMAQLPLYIEQAGASSRRAVVSHACVSPVWAQRESDPEAFREAALWSRKVPEGEACEIFNVFGHTPVRGGVQTGPCHVNVDTGCYLGRAPYGKLSAYCLQTGETVSVARVEGEEPL
jgi:serine/threonine protein phosphatase 1